MIWKVLTYKLIWLNIILFFIFTIGTYFFHPLAPFTGILLINIFDMYGYDFVLRNHWKGIQPDEEIVTAYRIIQKSFEGLVILFLFVLFDWQAALGCFLLIMFTVQDLIYYLFLQYPLPKRFTWIRWSPIGFIIGDVPTWLVIVQGVIGIIIVIGVNYL
uniref:Uncharacterized protein n=1 Tax=viral metagenome TaxID=1070528 RepID=A0A6M3XUN3_9ZZZZ